MQRKGLGVLTNSPFVTTTRSRKDVTDLLIEWSEGNQEALNKLMPLVYDELRRLASRYLRNERTGHTLQTTALVHEAYLKLVDQKNTSWENRVQFFAAAAQVMRHLLVFGGLTVEDKTAILRCCGKASNLFEQSCIGFRQRFSLDTAQQLHIDERIRIAYFGDHKWAHFIWCHLNQ